MDDLLSWILSNGVSRSEDELVEQLRKALSLTREKVLKLMLFLRACCQRGDTKSKTYLFNRFIRRVFWGLKYGVL